MHDEDRFRELLARHWMTLHDLGFVTDEEALVFRSVGSPPTYVEIFTWVEGGFGQAHEHPEPGLGQLDVRGLDPSRAAVGAHRQQHLEPVRSLLLFDQEDAPDLLGVRVGEMQLGSRGAGIVEHVDGTERLVNLGNQAPRDCRGGRARGRGLHSQHRPAPAVSAR